MLICIAQPLRLHVIRLSHGDRSALLVFCVLENRRISARFYNFSVILGFWRIFISISRLSPTLFKVLFSDTIQITLPLHLSYTEAPAILQFSFLKWVWYGCMGSSLSSPDSPSPGANSSGALGQEGLKLEWHNSAHLSDSFFLIE